jgi:hypothetical protein
MATLSSPKVIPFKDRHHEQVVALLKIIFGDEEIYGIEIGTNAGDFGKVVLRDVPNLKCLFTIDPWRTFEGFGYEAGHDQEYHNAQEKEARSKLAQYAERVHFIKETSDDAYIDFRRLPPLTHLGRQGFDFVWIDGHHEYKQVVKDLWNYWDLVRPGGILGGHDYKLVPDVTRAVDEFMSDKPLRTGGDYTYWTVKPTWQN